MIKPNIPFVEFPKIARLSREVVITEKIDGTNACIYIPDVPTCVCGHTGYDHTVKAEPCLARSGPSDSMCDCRAFKQVIFAGSRTKWITPDDDNHGFAKWVEANREDLLKLGPGRHYGEWWGQGIQRGYGLKEKRFSLFNTSRWGPGGKDEASKPACCYAVPVLYQGPFYSLDLVVGCLEQLRCQGSEAARGFMRPEGVVLFHTAANICFKKTLEKDDQPKGASA